MFLCSIAIAKIVLAQTTNREEKRPLNLSDLIINITVTFIQGSN